MKITITPNTKETQEQRKQRVQNDNVSRCNVYRNKKKYTRKNKYKPNYSKEN